MSLGRAWESAQETRNMGPPPRKPRFDDCTGGCGRTARGYDERSLPTCGEWPCGLPAVRDEPVLTLTPAAYRAYAAIFDPVQQQMFP